MEIIKITSGPLLTNTYVVCGKRACIVIDPTHEAVARIMGICQREGFRIEYIVNTHSHFDHITGNSEIIEQTDAVLAVPELDLKDVLSQHPELSNLIVVKLKEGSRVEIEDNVFTVMHTPGHTRGSISLYNEKDKILFSGDTLFAGSYGRTDLEGGDSVQMLESLKRIASLPEDVRVLPGHGSETRISDEKWLQRLTKTLPL